MCFPDGLCSELHPETIEEAGEAERAAQKFVELLWKSISVKVKVETSGCSGQICIHKRVGEKMRKGE